MTTISMIVTNEKWLRMAADRRFCAVPVERICLRFAGLEEVQVDRGRAPETERKGLTLRGEPGLHGYRQSMGRDNRRIPLRLCIGLGC